MFILTPLTLVATLALSNLLLNEPINLKQIIGIVLVLSGVLLI
jgi:drug/metabolite transporter (DMT)-like permease